MRGDLEYLLYGPQPITTRAFRKQATAVAAQQHDRLAEILRLDEEIESLSYKSRFRA